MLDGLGRFIDEKCRYQFRFWMVPSASAKCNVFSTGTVIKQNRGLVKRTRRAMRRQPKHEVTFVARPLSKKQGCRAVIADNTSVSDALQKAPAAAIMPSCIQSSTLSKARVSAIGIYDPVRLVSVQRLDKSVVNAVDLQYCMSFRFRKLRERKESQLAKVHPRFHWWRVCGPISAHSTIPI